MESSSVSFASFKDHDSQSQIPEIPLPGMNQAFEMVLAKIQELGDSQVEKAEIRFAKLEQTIQGCTTPTWSMPLRYESYGDQDSEQGFEAAEASMQPTPSRWSQALDASNWLNRSFTVESVPYDKTASQKSQKTNKRSNQSVYDKQMLSQKLLSLDHPHFVKSLLQKVVLHPAFDITFGILIMLNALSIGVETEYKTKHAQQTSPSFILQVVSYTFAILFFIELVLRLVANQFRRFFCGPERAWNIFDCGMVMISLVEVVDGLTSPGDSDANSGSSKLFQVLRMARLLRVLRVVRFSPQLRMIVFMILESTRAAGAVAIFLFATLYVFSIVLTMGATEYGRDRTFSAEIQQHYGTLVRSMYTCFKAITGGVSWGIVSDPLVDVGSFYIAIFLIFVSLSILALLNIITSVFVDGTIAKSQNDRDMVVEKKMQQRDSIVAHLRQIFVESDTDASGEISFEEFETHMQDPKIEAYFVHLSVDTSNVRKLFDQLDEDESGSVDIDEFVENLIHLSNVHNTDHLVQKVMNETRKVKKFLLHFADLTGGEVMRLGQRIDMLGAHVRQVADELKRLHEDRPPEISSRDVGCMIDMVRDGLCPVPEDRPPAISSRDVSSMIDMVRDGLVPVLAL